MAVTTRRTARGDDDTAAGQVSCRFEKFRGDSTSQPTYSAYQPNVLEANSSAPSVGHKLYIERAMEEQHEQARAILGRLMSHRLPGREVGVGAGADDLTIGVEPTFEHHDRVCSGVPVDPTSEAGRISDNIVLGAGRLILK